MNTEPKVLGPEDLENIIEYEKKELQKTIADDMEREMASWHAPWRKEALEHYLPLGWSFALVEGETLQAYFLAQPQLFTRSLTQSLWLEHLSFRDADEARELLDIAYRFSREKHLQALLLPKGEWTQYLPERAKAEDWNQDYCQVKTAKF